MVKTRFSSDLPCFFSAGVADQIFQVLQNQQAAYCRRNIAMSNMSAVRSMAPTLGRHSEGPEHGEQTLAGWWLSHP